MGTGRGWVQGEGEGEGELGESIGRFETVVTVLSAALQLNAWAFFRSSSLVVPAAGCVSVRFVDVRGFVSWVAKEALSSVGRFDCGLQQSAVNR